MSILLILEIGSPIKLLLKLKGDAASTVNWKLGLSFGTSMEGSYIIDSKTINGKPNWNQVGGKYSIRYDKENGTWVVVKPWTKGPTPIYSPNGSNGPLEANSWAYYNGKGEYIFSTDISLEKGNNAINNSIDSQD